MSTANHTTLSLPPARAAQLHAIATARECTLVEAVEHLIREEVRAGRLADVLPGFDVRVAAGHVHFAIGDVELPPMHPAHARLVAALFQHAASGMPAGLGNGLTIGSGNEFQLVVGRKGRGILGRLSCETLGINERFSMTLGMAGDLARQLAKAANAAQGL